jgi:hypothetical protein
MDKRKQSSNTPGKTPNRDNAPDDMRQAKMDEQRELKEEASLPDDPDPTLDEQDLEENDLSVDEADRIEWDPQSKENKRSGL